MKKIGGYVVWAITFVAAFVGVRAWKQHAFNSVDASAVVSTTIDGIKERGMARYPNLSPSDATAKEASLEQSASLAEESEQTNRENSAAAMFEGYYWINERSRPEFCKALGVDISSFTSAFEKEHSAMTLRADALFSRTPMTLEQGYEAAKPGLDKAIATAMNDFANAQHVSAHDACSLIAKYGDQIAASMQFSKAQPDVAAVLMQAAPK